MCKLLRVCPRNASIVGGVLNLCCCPLLCCVPMQNAAADGATCISPTCTTNCSTLNTECRIHQCSSATLTCIVTANRTRNSCNNTQGVCSNGVCVRNTTSCSLNCRLLNSDCRNYTCSAVTGTCLVAANRTGNSCNGTGTCSAGVCIPKSGCATNCTLLNSDCRNYTCSATTGTCVLAANRTGNSCNGTGTCSAGLCIPKSGCATNCTLLNTDCRNYTCAAATGACVVAANRTGNSCNGTQGVCSAAGLCAAKNTTTPG
jgi:hypothetical protein